jgi:hypothetical protein
VSGFVHSRLSSPLAPWRKKPQAIILLVIGLALTFRTVAILHFEALDHVTFSDRPNVAYALLHGRGYADTYGPGSGPTAHFPPFYTLLLTGIYGVFGFGPAGVLAAHIFGLAMVSAVILLMVPLASACGLPRTSAYLGGLIFAAPTSMIAENGIWEAPLTAAFICLTIIGAAKLLKDDQWTDRRAATAGFFFGIALLAAPPLAGWFGILALAVFFLLKQYRFALMVVSVAVLVLLPWIVRKQNSARRADLVAVEFRF